ncbi:unnamed protein product [Pleuronectes platessa]|uniref:Uncharacterized protein n=1 Tax=Pleuronectes platessa TaxID=8262 RepID=A0A9N7W3F9_PLEPL|nr:unnamed protein product [Pleuronectes platessa]
MRGLDPLKTPQGPRVQQQQDSPSASPLWYPGTVSSPGLTLAPLTDVQSELANRPGLQTAAAWFFIQRGQNCCASRGPVPERDPCRARRCSCQLLTYTAHSGHRENPRTDVTFQPTSVGPVSQGVLWQGESLCDMNTEQVRGGGGGRRCRRDGGEQEIMTTSVQHQPPGA